jgi:hypothetical protein
VITYALPDSVELSAAWHKAPDVVREELYGAMEESLIGLQAAVQDLTPVGAYGLLRQSELAQPVEALADQVIGVVGTSLQYAEAVELGTKPHFPPIEALEDWVKAKLHVDDADVKRVAFLVARKISISGTPAIGMFHRGLNKTREQIAQRFELARNRIVERLAIKGGHA